MRRFPTKLLMAALAIAGGYGLASLLSVVARHAAGEGGETASASMLTVVSVSPPTGPQEGQASDGNELLRRVLNTLERRPNLAAKVRQSLQIGNVQVAGTGVYCQQGVDSLRRSYFRLQSRSEAHEAAYTQVLTKDKEVWADRRVGDDRRVTRLQLSTIARELGPAAAASQLNALPPIVTVRGGLSQLIAELHRNFTFAAPRHSRIGDEPALAIVGHWRTERLAAAWPGLESGARHWPEQFPHSVLLVIGSTDLFPYLIEYRRHDASAVGQSAAAALPAANPLARYEFYEVQWAVMMPDDLFEFRENGVNFRDITARMIERLRPLPAENAEEVANARTASPR